MAKPEVLSEECAKALKLFEETVGYQTTFLERARKRYRSYLGILELYSRPDSWQSKMAPPYVRHIIETSLAALVAEKLTFRVKPRPKLYEPDEMENARMGAKAHEILHRYQLRRDRFDEKQRPFALQNAIVGFTVAKTFWRSDIRRRPQLKAVDIGLKQFGFPIGVFDLVEEQVTSRDFYGPTTEVVNIEDFFWHEAAVELQRSPIVAHRVWMHFNELKQAEASGRFSNVDELKESREQEDATVQLYDADTRKRTKDMIEVLEIWTREPDGIRVCTLGNRKVMLSPSRPNPFWHGEYPFVTASTEPDLFRIPGHSQVAKIASLQEGAWDFLNQTVDNVRLMNNYILGIDITRVEDPDAFEHGPGERWPVEGSVNDAIQQFKPDAITAQVAMPMIQTFERHMQNLAGTQPFTSTSEAGRVGADTATEAALVTNLAQQATKMQQTQLMLAYERVGQQRTELNKQFIRRPMMVEEIGLDSASEFVEIAPHLLQGDFDFDVTPMAESLMRSERRAEANALAQIMMQLIPIWLPMSQAGAVPPPNMERIIERLLEGYDEDSRAFFSAQTPPPVAPGAAPQQQGAPQQNGAGITSPLASGPMTPSGQVSVSPASHLQRLGAMSGGISNV